MYATYLTEDRDAEYIKNAQNSMVKQMNNSIIKWAKTMMRHFTKETIQQANKHIKKDICH